MLIKLDINKPTVILIDASYYVFYRYFATMRWFAFQKKVIDVNNITDNEEFIKCFLKHLNTDLNKILKFWKTNIDNIIFCSDCQRNNIWRNDIYKDYKSNRTQNQSFNSSIFNVFFDYIDKLGIKKVKFERLEADDIIYLLQNKLKLTYKIVIITNDNDYLQLASDNINIINMQFKDITNRCTKNPRMDLLYKAIYGDRSDNILKIAPFITKNKAIILSSMNDDELKLWLTNNNLIDKFNFNMELISFEKIPKKYVEDFYKNICIYS